MELMCKDCKLFKSDENFVKRPKNKSGYYSYCNSCNTQRAKEWNEKNKDRKKAYDAQYNKKHSEKKKIAAKLWATNNKSRKALADKNWRESNREKVRLSTNRANHVRRSKIKDSGTYTNEEWYSLQEIYRYMCLCCGITPTKLTIDHVIPISKGGKNTIDNIQPLCLGCNIRKGDKVIDYRVSHKPLFLL